MMDYDRDDQHDPGLYKSIIPSLVLIRDQVANYFLGTLFGAAVIGLKVYTIMDSKLECLIIVVANYLVRLLCFKIFVHAVLFFVDKRLTQHYTYSPLVITCATQKPT